MKILALIILLLCACAGTVRAQSRNGFNGSDAAYTPGHANDQLGSPVDQAHLTRQKQHTENARTQSANPTEGQRTVFQGKALVFHKGKWQPDGDANAKQAEPVEGQHGVYQGKKLVFHQGKWYYDRNPAPGKKWEPVN